MFPSKASANCPNGLPSNSIDRGYLLICFSIKKQIFYFSNLFMSKLISSIMLSVHNAISALSPHIKRIVFMGSNEQMIWPNTSAVIASMKNVHPHWDLAKVKFPTYAVSKLWDRFVNFCSDSYHSIAARISSPYPFPTSMEWNHNYLFPKFVFDSLSRPHGGAI